SCARATAPTSSGTPRPRVAAPSPTRAREGRRPRSWLSLLMMFAESTTSLSDMSDLPLSELEDELASLAAHMSAGMCRMLEIVGEVDRREAWTGWSSCAAWLAWRCALSPRSAREQVRVARALRELPLIRASFSSGELTYSKVRALTRVATADTEAELLDFAGVLTAAQLERALRAYARVSTHEAHELQKWERLDYFWDDGGNLIVPARLPPED